MAINYDQLLFKKSKSLQVLPPRSFHFLARTTFYFPPILFGLLIIIFLLFTLEKTHNLYGLGHPLGYWWWQVLLTKLVTPIPLHISLVPSVRANGFSKKKCKINPKKPHKYPFRVLTRNFLVCNICHFTWMWHNFHGDFIHYKHLWESENKYWPTSDIILK